MRSLTALVLVLCMAGCKSSTAPKATVVFDHWSSFGSTGAVGVVKNTGGATAHRVAVRSSSSYEVKQVNSSPSEIPAGGTASFSGAGSGPGVIAPPTIEWIKWD